MLPTVLVRVLDLTGGISDRYDVCVAAEEFTDQWVSFVRLMLQGTFSWTFMSPGGGGFGQQYVRFAIILATPKDKKASLVIHGLVDKVSFPERPDMKPVELKEQPFSLQRETSMNRSFFMLLKLNFTDGCSCLSSSIGWPVDFQKQKDSFVRDKTLVIPELQCAAEHESCAGQQEILERESLPRAETAIHAIVTNVVRYDMGNNKISLPRDKGVNCSSSNSGKRNISGCYPSAPKKLKYFLKDEKLNC
nr:unnamed protein product [Digitaria exilis]